MDDKHRCKVGEPGLPVAVVERGKQVVVITSGKKFAVADHDFTKLAINPSVTVVFRGLVLQRTSVCWHKGCSTGSFKYLMSLYRAEQTFERATNQGSHCANLR